MHLSARLFQPRVKNGLSNIMTLWRQWRFSPIGFVHSSLALANWGCCFLHQIAPMTLRFLCRPGLFVFSEFWLGVFRGKTIFTIVSGKNNFYHCSGEKQFLPCFNVREETRFMLFYVSYGLHLLQNCKLKQVNFVFLVSILVLWKEFWVTSPAVLLILLPNSSPDVIVNLV